MLFATVSIRLQSIKQWSTQCLGGECSKNIDSIVDSVIIVFGVIGSSMLTSLFLDIWASRGMITQEREGVSFSNLNPAQGLKGIYSKVKWLPFHVVCFVGFSLAIGTIADRLITYRFAALSIGPSWAVNNIISDGYYLLAWGGGLGLVVAFLDNFKERFVFTKKHRMSLQDLKEEFKKDEGDPLMKAQRRAMYDELMLSNLESRVKKSEFILIERVL